MNTETLGDKLRQLSRRLAKEKEKEFADKIKEKLEKFVHNSEMYVEKGMTSCFISVEFDGDNNIYYYIGEDIIKKFALQNGLECKCYSSDDNFFRAVLVW